MNKVLALALGIVTSVGGFLEVGSLATSAQAGAAFGFQLAWAVVLGAVCLIFLVEMSGRLAAVSRHTICDAVRERFGATFFVIPLVVLALVTLLVLGAEIGGVCLALQLATGIGIQWWALPVAFAVWLLLWKATFGVIENGVSLLGLVTVVFVVGALMLKPSWGDVGRGLLPSMPTREASRYWLLAVGILGASITPYLFYFYSSGAVEDEWEEDDLSTNRVVAIVGMSFGALLAVAVLVVAGLVFHPRGIRIERYDQMALMLTEPLGFWGFVLFVLSLGIACFGAALEVSLALAYLVAQGLGWNWGENVRPRKAARFATVYTAALLLGALLTAVGVDPLRLTVVAMVLTAATLPLAVVPFLIVMNDEHYVGEHVNGWLGNGVVLAVTALACVLAIVSLPLQIFGG